TSQLPGPGQYTAIATWVDAVSGSSQISLAYDSNGTFGFYSGSGLQGGPSLTLIPNTQSASGALVAGAYNQIEVKVTFANPSGHITMRLNATTIIDVTVRTQYTANNTAGSMIIGSARSDAGNPGNNKFDDYYILDLTLAAPMNNFLGVVRIQTDGAS